MRARKPLLVERFELFAEFALAAADDGGEDGDALAGSEGGDALHNLLRGLTRDGAVAVWAVRLADAGVEQAEVVVDFGDGADGGARGAGGGFLLDGDGGGEAVDGVDVGPLHLVEELAGVGGEGFDVAALAFGIDGVESERAFTRARKAGDDGESVARDGHVDVAQVVLARALDGDVCDAGACGGGPGQGVPRPGRLGLKSFSGDAGCCRERVRICCYNGVHA